MTALCFDPTVDTDFGMAASLADASCRRLLVSDQYAELLMRPKEDLLNLPWQATANPDDFQKLALPVNRLLARGDPFEQRCRVLRSDGVWLDLVYKVTQSYDKRSGRIVIQSNVRVRDKQADQTAPGPVAEAAALADFIRDMSQQLGKLAGERKMALLRYYLAMASAEAGQECERLAEESRLLERVHRIVH